MHQVYVVEPNNLGNGYITDWYRFLVSYLKYMPFLYIIPLSLAGTVFVYLLVGPLLVRLATLLQYGF